MSAVIDTLLRHVDIIYVAGHEHSGDQELLGRVRIAVVAEAFREFLHSRLPQDLLADLGVSLKDGDFAVNVELRREPTEDELDQLNRVVQTATAEFRRRGSAR
ncbi:hypothetical protein [Nonomuraea sp. NPDC049504]|uniref:hypothetical protein n=1 Tax=Nonomuraea sp. NPDC049504 TaxID=3154729 RepID=UPI0034475F45